MPENRLDRCEKLKLDPPLPHFHQRDLDARPVPNKAGCGCSASK